MVEYGTRGASRRQAAQREAEAAKDSHSLVFQVCVLLRLCTKRAHAGKRALRAHVRVCSYATVRLRATWLNVVVLVLCVHP